MTPLADVFRGVTRACPIGTDINFKLVIVLRISSVSEMGNMQLKEKIIVRSAEEADERIATLEESASRVAKWVSTFHGHPLDLIRQMKFDLVGLHPITHSPLNVIEQVNQTWTYVAALLAARKLFDLHPDAGAFHLAPGAHASQPLDIMSEVEGLVGGETFAAVKPQNNRKLANDLDKLMLRHEKYRYVFFMSPAFPGTKRLERFERGGVEVWSVDL